MPAPYRGNEDALEKTRRTHAGAGRRLKKLSRSLVIALVVVVALAAFNVSIPAGKSAGSNWKFALSHPTILLHVIVATGALVAAAVAVIMSLGSRDRLWFGLSVAGLAFVLLAFAAGVDYVNSLQTSALDYMSIGWAGAVITYGAGWYLGHRKERGEGKAHVPGS